MISGTTIAQQKEISIEKYQMENICYNPYDNYKSSSFNRYYKFTFHSYYSVFENYSLLNDRNNMVHLETNLYKVNYSNPILDYSYLENSPKIITNKKTIEIVLDEDDMKKLYQSNYAKVVFNRALFATDYVKLEVVRPINSDDGYYQPINPFDRVHPTPVISIPLNKNEFNYALAECNKIHNIYNKEYDEYHSKPINRLKSFFGF
jgi:hypothetical protein